MTIVRIGQWFYVSSRDRLIGFEQCAKVTLSVLWLFVDDEFSSCDKVKHIKNASQTP